MSTLTTAAKQSDARLRSAGRFIQEQSARAVVKVADDLIETVRLGDQVATSIKNLIPQPQYSADGIGIIKSQAENTHSLENGVNGLEKWMKNSIGKGLAPAIWCVLCSAACVFNQIIAFISASSQDIPFSNIVGMGDKRIN